MAQIGTFEDEVVVEVPVTDLPAEQPEQVPDEVEEPTHA
jgi:hypothetical protein